MGFNVPVLTEEELADVFAVFQAADRTSKSPMSISLMAERMFAALDAGERDPLRLKAAVLNRPAEEVPWEFAFRTRSRQLAIAGGGDDAACAVRENYDHRNSVKRRFGSLPEKDCGALFISQAHAK